MTDPTLALCLQQLQLHQNTSVLWIVDEHLSAADLMDVRPAPTWHALSNRFDVAALLNKHGLPTTLNDFDFSALPTFQVVLYRVSKEKLLVHHCVNQALQRLTTGGELRLAGSKQDGIKSLAKKIAEQTGLNVQIKKHGTAYLVTVPAPATVLSQEQLLPDNDYPRVRKIDSAGYTFYSKPGIFGWQKVDRGSQLLLSVLPEVCKYIKSVDSVIDIGCGWGYLMLGTANMPIARRVATDNNAAALLAAQKNFDDAGLTVDCVLDDCAQGIRERFDLILVNPPFHQGFNTRSDMTERFIKAAARLSRRSTRAVFVVNQFIPLDKLAAPHFSQCRVMAASDGFTVYELRP